MEEQDDLTDGGKPLIFRRASTKRDTACPRVVLPVAKLTDETNRIVANWAHESSKTFTKLGWKCTLVLFVKPESEDEARNELASHFDTIVTGDLAATVSDPSCDIDLIVVADLDVCLEATQWSWLLESSRESDVVSCFQRVPLRGKWYARLGESCAALFSRTLLRTGKNTFRPGIVIFKANKIRPLIEEGVPLDSPESLICCCRADGQSIFEAELNVPHNCREAVALRSSASLASNNIRFWWNHIAFPTQAQDSPMGPAEPPSSLKLRWFASALLLAAAVFVLFLNLGYPLFEPDEARNAQLGLNIYESGDWMSPTLFDDLYWDKPPLQAWMTAASYHLFGPSSLATRLPCALISFLTLAMVFLFGGKLFGFRTGFLGALLLLLCSGFSLAARYVTMDASLTCFATAMFLATLLGTRKEKISTVWMALAGIACGLGFLTKGPVIAVLVLPPILLAGWLEKKKFYFQPRFWLSAGIPAFLISAPWFLATSIVHPDFLVYFFWKHNLVRFSDAFNHQQPWWFYIPITFLIMYPAGFLLLAFTKSLFLQSRSQKRKRGPEFGILILYVLWVIGFFSLSDSKLPTYILPAIPIFCLLLGRTMESAVFASVPHAATNWKQAMPRKIAWSVLTMFLVITVVLAIGFSMYDPIFLLTTGLFVTAGAILCLCVCGRSSNARISWGATAVIAVAFMSLFSSQLLPKIAESRSLNLAISRLVESPHQNESPIVFIGRPPYAYSFWLSNQNIYHFGGRFEFKSAEFLAKHDRAIVVASRDDIEKLENRLESKISFNKEPHHRNLYTTRANPLARQSSVELRILKPISRRAKRTERSGLF